MPVRQEQRRTRSEEVAAAADLTVEQVQRVFRDIDQKRRTTEYLHLAPELIEDVPEIAHTTRR